MTLAIFPSFKGQTYDNLKRGEFKTTLFESLSGNESRVGFRTYPKYIFKIPLIQLIEDYSKTEMQQFFGFLLQHRGMLTPFWYDDPLDNSISEEVIGTGDGSATDFQLVRSLGGFTEPVNNKKGTANIYVDDELVPIDDRVISATGLVTFNTPPVNNAVITWSGFYYYRCRFTEDSKDILQSSKTWFETSDIEFVGSVRNIV